MPTFKAIPLKHYIGLIALVALCLGGWYCLSLVPLPQTQAWQSPVFSPPGGVYTEDTLIHLVPENRKTQILFTLDGHTPTLNTGTIYTRPIQLQSNIPGVTVIRARIVYPDGELGPVANASYFMNLQATLPMLSLIVEPEDLWDPTLGIYANSLQTGAVWERPTDVTYVDKDREKGFHIQAGIRIHGQRSRDFAKKSFRLYFRRDYGTGKLEYPLFGTDEIREFDNLILHCGGQDWQTFPHINWTLIRNQLAAILAFEVDGYATYSQPALLFINGEPWGIYEIRERVDERLLENHYGVTDADFMETPELQGQRSIISGDAGNWDQLLSFVESHDLSQPENYAYVESQVDIDNFIDYNILQIYAANIDWPHHNVHQFRPRVPGGRWHWLFWDSDHGFATNVYTAVDLNLIQRALDYDHPETGGRDVLLLRKLLENQAFLERFLSRASDLLNTTLIPEVIRGHIDDLTGELEPDIAYENIRWGGSVSWAASIEELQDFARKRPAFVYEHMVEQFGLDGTAALTLTSPTTGEGSVSVNGTLVQTAPWTGTYFQGIPVHLTAAPKPGYEFTGWDPVTLPQTPSITVTLDISQTIAPRFGKREQELNPDDVIFTQVPDNKNSHRQDAQIELQIIKAGGVDIRGWRITDNDTKTAHDEGSIVFANIDAFANVPARTTIEIIVPHNPYDLPPDDLNILDRHMVLYVGNGTLEIESDPDFNLGPADNLALLAPGTSPAFEDDRGIDFVSYNPAITPESFGILSDGVVPRLNPESEVRTQAVQDYLYLGLALTGLSLGTLYYTKILRKTVH